MIMFLQVGFNRTINDPLHYAAFFTGEIFKIRLYSRAYSNWFVFCDICHGAIVTITIVICQALLTEKYIDGNNCIMKQEKTEQESATVRIRSDLKEQVEKYADTVRPKSSIQYVVEAALEHYFKTAEHRPKYGQTPPDKKD